MTFMIGIVEHETTTRLRTCMYPEILVIKSQVLFASMFEARLSAGTDRQVSPINSLHDRTTRQLNQDPFPQYRSEGPDLSVEPVQNPAGPPFTEDSLFEPTQWLSLICIISCSMFHIHEFVTPSDHEDDLTTTSIMPD